MHDYSIDKNPKAKVLFILAILAMLAATGLQNLVDSLIMQLELHSNWTVPIIAIPTFGVYLGFYFLFNKYLWKIKFIRKFLLVPDMNGTWSCDGNVCLKNGKPCDFDWSGVITITQSWSKILIHLKSSQSGSKSLSASIYHDQGVGYRLLYQYNNEPNADQQDLKNHSGACELLFDEELLSAYGSYYTDRHRTTVGTMSLKKKSDTK